MPKKSEHKGASEERQVWMRKLQRMLITHPDNRALNILEAWGKSRVKRFRARKGGL